MQIRSTSPTTAYTDYLGKEKNIDDLYMKSIKMKIATAQISSWNDILYSLPSSKLAYQIATVYY